MQRVRGRRAPLALFFFTLFLTWKRQRLYRAEYAASTSLLSSPFALVGWAVASVPALNSVWVAGGLLDATAEQIVDFFRVAIFPAQPGLEPCMLGAESLYPDEAQV